MIVRDRIKTQRLKCRKRSKINSRKYFVGRRRCLLHQQKSHQQSVNEYHPITEPDPDVKFRKGSREISLSPPGYQNKRKTDTPRKHFTPCIHCRGKIFRIPFIGFIKTGIQRMVPGGEACITSDPIKDTETNCRKYGQPEQPRPGFQVVISSLPPDPFYTPGIGLLRCKFFHLRTAWDKRTLYRQSVR